MSTHSLVFSQIITGISIGSRLFLVAIGLSLIFGVLDVLNFAHGVLYMIGAYMAILAVESAVGSFVLGIVAAIFTVAVVGGILEAVFIRQLYGRDEEVLDQLLLTFAFVLIIEDGVRSTFGSQPQLISAPESLTGTVSLGAGLSIPTYRGFVIVMAVLVLSGLLAVLRYTNIGRIVRATSSDREMARLLGINVPSCTRASSSSAPRWRGSAVRWPRRCSRSPRRSATRWSSTPSSSWSSAGSARSSARSSAP